MIPALENAEFVRYGVMHRNTFIDSPRLLGSDFGFKAKEGLYFAGEIIDVDAYTGGFNLQIAFSTGFLAGNK